MSLGLVALIAVGWFGLIFWVLAILRSGARRTPAPPARPRQRRVELDLSEIEWDWKLEDAA